MSIIFSSKTASEPLLDLFSDYLDTVSGKYHGKDCLNGSSGNDHMAGGGHDYLIGGSDND
ncbi:hypothetical protein [Stenoxybacter acetivorans]|uniref:hypothetical protein n=1 Tax=Stenoxybacter acetivorans TaxID=422441 RepID=UPI0012EB3D98|nr:hypothetical protein [Stenoxybacter acetivorans]